MCQHRTIAFRMKGDGNWREEGKAEVLYMTNIHCHLFFIGLCQFSIRTQTAFVYVLIRIPPFYYGRISRVYPCGCICVCHFESTSVFMFLCSYIYIYNMWIL